MDYGGDLLSGPGIMMSAGGIQGVHVSEVLGHETPGQFPGTGAHGLGPGDDLVVNIGEILNVAHPVAPELQVTAHGIKSNVAHSVTDVAAGGGSNPTHIHLDLAAGRTELFFAADKGIIDPHPAPARWG